MRRARCADRAGRAGRSACAGPGLRPVGRGRTPVRTTVRRADQVSPRRSPDRPAHRRDHDGTVSPTQTPAAAAPACRSDSPHRRQSRADLLAGLHGKDVIVAFVESYGRVAVQDSTMAPGVDATLDAGTQALAAGRIPRPQRLPHLTDVRRHQLAGALDPAVRTVDRQPAALRPAAVASDRLTLSRGVQAGRAGARSADVAVERQGLAGGQRRSTTTTRSTTAATSATAGPKFSYADMPDQYILSAFQRMELAGPGPAAGDGRDRPGVQPLRRGRRCRAWSTGTTSATARSSTACPSRVNRRTSSGGPRADVQAAYGQSIQYSLNTLISFVQTYGDQNLVLVMLGDHQPATVGQRTNAHPRRADLDHRARPRGAEPDLRVGLAGRVCDPTHRRRSGRWTPSATGSSPPTAGSGPPVTIRTAGRPVRSARPPTRGGTACGPSRRRTR